MSKATKELYESTARDIAEYITSNGLQDVGAIGTVVRLRMEAGIEKALKDSYEEVNLRREAATVANGKKDKKTELKLKMYRTLLSEIKKENKYKKLTEFIRGRNPEILEEFYRIIEKEE